MNENINYWIFQASPKKYDVNTYLIEESEYIYWGVNQKELDMRKGDIVFFWRGKMDGYPSGLIAKGIIREIPVNIQDVKFPTKVRNDLWHINTHIDDKKEVGVKIFDIRLTQDEGMLCIDELKDNPILKNLAVITSHRQTNYLLGKPQGQLIEKLWLDRERIERDFVDAYINENENEIEKNILALEDIPETTKIAIVKSRRGQGKFKEKVSKIEKFCRLTGVEDINYLIASHIKPWRESSNEERLDENNGLLLAPHVDFLFDRGFISFADDGELLVSNSDKHLKKILHAWSVDSSKGTGKFNDRQKYFLKYHREVIFKGIH